MKFALRVVQGVLMGIGAGYLLLVIYQALSDGLECWRAPPEVEFHQGMTLCPGQSARMHITIPLEKDDGA